MAWSQSKGASAPNSQHTTDERKEAHMAAIRRWRPRDPSGSGHHDAAIHALDATDAAMDHEEVDGCGICDSDLENFRETASHLAQAVAAAPPAHLKAAVFMNLAQNRRGRHRVLQIFFGSQPIQPADDSESPMTPPDAEQ